MKCGDANLNGNVELFYKGACKENLKMEDAYRCTGCGSWFHFDCILDHFELEDEHDVARNSLRKIKDYSQDKRIIELCKNGLKKIIPVGG